MFAATEDIAAKIYRKNIKFDRKIVGNFPIREFRIVDQLQLFSNLLISYMMKISVRSPEFHKKDFTITGLVKNAS